MNTEIDYPDQFETYLRQIAEFRAKYAPGTPYSCAEDFVLRHGRYTPAKKLPRKLPLRRGRMKMCFKNAFNWAHKRPDLYTYCEGYGHNIIPVIHAWVIDRDGNVIDPTWKDQETKHYWGVPFKLDYVTKRVLSTRTYCSMLDNFAERYPLFTGAHKIEEAIAA